MDYRRHLADRSLAAAYDAEARWRVDEWRIRGGFLQSDLRRVVDRAARLAAGVDGRHYRAALPDLGNDSADCRVPFSALDRGSRGGVLSRDHGDGGLG